MKAAARWLRAFLPHPASPYKGEEVPLLCKEGQGEVEGVFSRILSLNEDLTDLQSDFVRLFQSSPRDFCHPYEGAYVDPERTAALIFRLECEYAQAGLKLSVKDSPDHAATELEFMSYLCGLEARAAEANVQEAAVGWRRYEQHFLRDHPARWFPPFARRVREKGEGVYAGVCSAAERFILADLTALSG